MELLTAYFNGEICPLSTAPEAADQAHPDENEAAQGLTKGELAPRASVKQLLTRSRLVCSWVSDWS